MLFWHSKYKRRIALALLAALAAQALGSVTVVLRLDRYIYVFLSERGIAETVENEESSPPVCQASESVAQTLLDKNPTASHNKVRRRSRPGCTCPYCRPYCPMGEACRCMERRAHLAMGGVFFETPGCHPGDPLDMWNSENELAGIYLEPAPVRVSALDAMTPFWAADMGPLEPDPDAPPCPPPKPSISS
jgi:hypothetical protein